MHYKTKYFLHKCPFFYKKGKGRGGLEWGVEDLDGLLNILLWSFEQLDGFLKNEKRKIAVG